MKNEQECTTRIIDEAGILGMMDADNYTTWLQRRTDYVDLMTQLTQEMNMGVGIFWGTGREDEWIVQIRYGFTEEKGFRQFTNFLRIESGNLILADIGEMLAGADDSLLFPHDLYAVSTVFPSGLYLCRVLQMYDPSDWNDEPESRSFDFIIELVVAPFGSRTQSGNVSDVPWL